MISRFASAAARAAGLLIFALTLVAAESGTPIGGVAQAVVAIEYLLKCPAGTVLVPNQKRCISAARIQRTRTQAPPAAAPPPACRSDQVLIAGKVCGCPAQTRAQRLASGVFKCLPYP